MTYTPEQREIAAEIVWNGCQTRRMAGEDHKDEWMRIALSNEEDSLGREITLQCHVNALREALQPFADFAAVYQNMKGLAQEVVYECNHHQFGSGKITGDMLTSAIKTLAQTAPKESHHVQG